MSAPRCLIVGAGRMTGGYVAPMLRAAGWEVTLACRDPKIRDAIASRGGFALRITGETGSERWIDGIEAVALDDPALGGIAGRADLLATAVGPSALPSAGRLLAPLLRARLEAGATPVNVVTFENHRRAPELLLGAMVAAEPSLAPLIGRRLGISGSAVWRIIASRVVTDAGVRFDANDEDECFADALAVLPGIPPGDGSVPGITLVRGFDDRMVEKLWLFNAGHCAAAYLGWAAGFASLGEAMGDAAIHAAVCATVAEAQAALGAQVAARPRSTPLPVREVDGVVARYLDPTLVDPVTRVGREPRRKLGPDDRLIGPAVAALAAGQRPIALAQAAAAALAYGEASDPQAADLQRELALVGPEETLATVSGLHPTDELSRLICSEYGGYARLERDL